MVAGCLPKAIAAQLFTPYMLNLGLLSSLPLIYHQLAVVFHHKKAPPSGGAIDVTWLGLLEL
jgi:hypothetical protein